MVEVRLNKIQEIRIKRLLDNGRISSIEKFISLAIDDRIKLMHEREKAQKKARGEEVFEPDNYNTITVKQPLDANTTMYP